MANSEHLRENKNQHKPKNKESKIDDKIIYQAMKDVINYLKKRLETHLANYELIFKKEISFEEMIFISRQSGLRTNYDSTFINRTIRPDGGLIMLTKPNDPSYKKILLIAETKRQGTNDARVREGKRKQAQGNAIERLGKNLTGIKAMLNHEKITPFACFGWGCDFEWDYNEKSFVTSKLIMLNEFYPINKIYVHKQDGGNNQNTYAPVTMYFREKQWKIKEIFDILKEIAESSLRYYIF